MRVIQSMSWGIPPLARKPSACRSPRAEHRRADGPVPVRPAGDAEVVGPAQGLGADGREPEVPAVAVEGRLHPLTFVRPVQTLALEHGLELPWELLEVDGADPVVAAAVDVGLLVVADVQHHVGGHAKGVENNLVEVPTLSVRILARREDLVDVDLGQRSSLDDPPQLVVGKAGVRDEDDAGAELLLGRLGEAKDVEIREGDGALELDLLVGEVARRHTGEQVGGKLVVDRLDRHLGYPAGRLYRPASPCARPAHGGGRRAEATRAPRGDRAREAGW